MSNRHAQVATGLRSVASDMEIFTEGPWEGNPEVFVPLATLKDWIGDIRVCADDVEDLT